jgi:hypothetical protein
MEEGSFGARVKTKLGELRELKEMETGTPGIVTGNVSGNKTLDNN